MTSLMRLYPRDWRARYEDEFLSLLAERPPDARDRVDIVRGAVDARLHPQVRKGGGVDPEPATGRVADRALGWLTLAGAVSWVTALVVYANGPMVTNEYGTYRDGMAAVPFTFTAFVLLGAGIVQVARALPLGSDAAGLAAALAVVCGVIWAAMPWVFPLLIVASIGYVVLAVSARRAGVMGVGDASLLIGGLAIAWAFAISGMLGIGAGPDPGFNIAFAAFWVAISSIWFAVGHALIVGHRSTATAGSAAGE